MTLQSITKGDPRGLDRINALIAQVAALTGNIISGAVNSVGDLPDAATFFPGTRFLVLNPSSDDDDEEESFTSAARPFIYEVSQSHEWRPVGELGSLQGDIPQATPTQSGLMTPAMLQKLLGIEYGATNFTLPSSFPAAMIDESPEQRFVSDDWRDTINGFLESGDGTNLAALIERLAHVEWQLAIQGILDGVDGIVIDTIDSPTAVSLVSGQFANGRIFI